ncbi:MAG: hypothetical protein ACFCVF_09155 [Kineosporiaceae bacterium]
MTSASDDPGRSPRATSRAWGRDVGGDFTDERVAALVAALRRPPAAGELAAEASMMAAFTVAGAGRDAAGRGRRTTMRARLAARWAVVAAAVTTLTLGTAAAAYTGSLPGPLRDAAHQVMGSPAAEPAAAPPILPAVATASGTPSATVGATGPGTEVPGPAAFGLCTAYAAGDLDPQSPVGRALADAAGGDGIEQFCAEVERRGPPDGIPTTGVGGAGRPTSGSGAPPVAVTTDGSTDHPTDPSPSSSTDPSVAHDPPAAPESSMAPGETPPAGGAAAGAGREPDPLPMTSPTS